VCLGRTFRDVKRKRDTHLWIIISHRTNDNKVVTANFTSSLQDQSCIVEPSEYEELSRRSCIYYRDARLVPFEKLVKAGDAGLLSWGRPVPEPVLTKIHKGAVETEYIKQECREVLRRQDLLPEEPEF
jgi:hypothetical protein